MAVLTKHTGAKIRSISGPLSLITKSLGGDKKVLAIELKPEQWHLEERIFEALDLLASMVEQKTAKLTSEKIRGLSEFLISGFFVFGRSFSSSMSSTSRCSRT